MVNCYPLTLWTLAAECQIRPQFVDYYFLTGCPFKYPVIDFITMMSIAYKVTFITKVSVYCTASKRILLHWHITSVDPPGIMFVKFFCEKYLLDMHKHNGNTHLPTLCAGEATVKINKLWPNVYVHSSLAGV